MKNSEIKAIHKAERLLNLYKSRKLEKFDYLDEIHEFNEILVFYAKQINDKSIIKKIEIEDEKIIFTTRQNIRFACTNAEKRGTLFMALNLGMYEEEDTLIYSLINENSTCFDIGANVGWFSLHLAKKMSGIQIHAFEPVPVVFNNFQTNLTLNAIDGIYTYNLGFSNQEHEQELHFSPSMTTLSSFKQLFPEQTSKVKCFFTTLDNFVKKNQFKKIDFLKIDVEGAEFLVIEGAGTTLQQYHPVLFLEMYEGWTARFGYTPDNLIQKLLDFDYECFIFCQNKLQKIKSYEEGRILGKYNFFFLNRAKHSTFLHRLT